MGIKTIDGYLLRKMIIQGANKLKQHKNFVNELNVFPVPDGDTGSNMFLTIKTTAEEVVKLNTPNVAEVAKVASSGSLRGARGNSGVILSQLFRGFHRGLENASVLNATGLANAFSKATEIAYKAVMKPREGTILTIASAISFKAEEMAGITDDIEIILKEVIEYSKKILLKTTDMLPELKAANVVDSGGQGLIFILEGAFESIYMEDVELDSSDSEQNNNSISGNYLQTEDVDIKFGYCTEFFININNGSEKLETDVKRFLDVNGDSIVAVWDDDIVKVHVHTNHPGKVLEYALTKGNISNIKIENMRIQHTNLISFVKEEDKQISSSTNVYSSKKKNIGIISVASGKGLINLFKELGVDQVIEGGQSMNPSTEDITNVIDKINADNIIILPNNRNIILVAEQASKVSNKNVHVVKTKTIPEGVSAVINFQQIDSIEDNLKNANEAIGLVKTGQITYAVRDTVINDISVIKGDILGIVGDEIKAVSKNKEDCIKEILNCMVDDESEVLTIYYGKDIEAQQIDALETSLKEVYPSLEIEIYNGEQSIYSYIVSVE